jgi:hypothetical protein
MVAGDRMGFASRYHEVVEVSWRGYLLCDERLDRKEADDDSNNKGVEVVSQEGRFDATDVRVHHDTDWEEERRRNDVHSGSIVSQLERETAMAGQGEETYTAEIAALAPRSMFATAMILLIRQRIIQTMWPTVPYRIRIISSKVWACGTLSLQAIPRTEKKTIMGEHLDHHR